MQHFVFSTLTAGQEYAQWEKAGGDGVMIKVKSVKINGGANLNTKQLVTPLGAVTRVNDDELAFLESNECFQIHVKNGHIKVERKNVSISKAVADMKPKDKSAPRTPADYLAGTATGSYKVEKNVNLARM